jgi:hypothetical protein
MAAIDHFREDISRAFAIVNVADSLPELTPAQKLVRDDLLRSSLMFGVGSLDAYFCDLYTDLLASVLMCKERQGNINLPLFLLSLEVPLEAVFDDYAQRRNWRWRMMARRRMERENVLSIDSVKKLLNPFLQAGHKLFVDVIDGWIQKPGATRRIFGSSTVNYQNAMAAAIAEIQQDKREKKIQGLRNNAAGALNKRFSQIIQRRHDCIHNCDRPRSVPKRIRSAASIRLILNDIDFLVRHVDEHVDTEFPQFLSSLGCTAITINQVGY